MQINKRVEHHDCCGTCAMYQEDDEIDTYGREYWFCLENADTDCDSYPSMRYYQDDDEQVRLKFFMICDSYLRIPTTSEIKKPDNEGQEQEQS